MLGANALGLNVIDLDAYATDEQVAGVAPGIRAFRAWVLERYGLARLAPWAARRAPGRTLNLTLVDRGAAAKRRLVDQGAVAAAARAAGFAVAVVDFEALPLREQLQVLHGTDVLVPMYPLFVECNPVNPRQRVCAGAARHGCAGGRARRRAAAGHVPAARRGAPPAR